MGTYLMPLASSTARRCFLEKLLIHSLARPTTSAAVGGTGTDPPGGTDTGTGATPLGGGASGAIGAGGAIGPPIWPGLERVERLRDGGAGGATTSFALVAEVAAAAAPAALGAAAVAAAAVAAAAAKAAAWRWFCQDGRWLLLSRSPTTRPCATLAASAAHKRAFVGAGEGRRGGRGGVSTVEQGCSR